ncbi:hypothetical protein [Streptomyces sp. SYP-A7185]|uniref:hypothetical protein n=1 Tax=Streptomyces sp. SYP-A7185 TaxID=3040076 RepID=UPI0038F6B064
MSAAAAPRTARFYTAARRHPWVLGKLADWRLPLGPYNAAQIALATVGGFLLVKTIAVWSVLGPIPVAAWLVGIWLLRRPKIGGRHPVSVALGLVALMAQPAGGRIGRRAARDPRARRLSGGFILEDLTNLVPAAGAPAPRPPQQAARVAPTQPAPPAHPRPPRPAPAAATPASGATRPAALLAHARRCAPNQKGHR